MGSMGISVKRISIDLIDPPDTALRDNIDMEKVRELAESIRERGLQQPITVTKRGERYEVVSGHRRYLAHRVISATTIDCIVREVAPHEMLLARAVENLQREDLSPMETARVYASIRDSLKLSIEGVAKSLGKNKMTIWKYLQLLEMPADIQGAIDAGGLSIAAGVELMKIDDVPSRNYYLKSAVENGITLPIAQMWVSDYERTRQGTYYQGSEGGPGLDPHMGVKPTYVACDCCFGSVDIRVMRHVTVCESCERMIKQPKVEGGA